MNQNLYICFGFLLLLCCLQNVESYKILVSILTASKSHYNQGKAIADVLHDRGHEVTFINGYGLKKVPYREIIIPEVSGDFDINFEDVQEASLWNNFIFYSELVNFVPFMLKAPFESEKLLTFFNDKTEDYDLVIFDYVMNEAFLALGVKYDCPVIYLSGSPMMQQLARITNNPVNPATIPNIMLGLSNDMSFGERVLNTLMAIQEDFFSLTFNKVNREYYEKYFPEEAKKVDYADLKKKIALVLCNSHPSLEIARPFLPNVVEINGFHIQENETLPKEYKDIIEGAKHGVVFFSLGSFVQTHKMPVPMREAILKSLGKLKETVLWKFETELENLPKNVIIRKWMPQPSILAHPNVKLFISHGGMLSTTEAVASGKPALMIPVFADQYGNAKIIERAGSGEILTLNKISEENLDAALGRVLNNKTVTENAKMLKKRFMDRPISPRNLIVFHVEQVIRTGGAKYLSTRHLNIFSSMLLDVFAVLLIPPIIFLYILIWTCRKVCCMKKSKSKTTTKEKVKKIN